MFGSQELVTT